MSSSTSNADVSTTSSREDAAQLNLETPFTPQNPTINRLLQQMNQGNNEPSSKHGKYIQMAPEQFHSIMTTGASQQDFITKLLESPHSSIFSHQTNRTHPTYYNNAQFDENATRPIKPIYDGLEDQLIPFLACLDIRCQYEGLASATFVFIKNI
jgi:hypothetical protein